MNRSLEAALRFVNLTTSGLLAGSLGFGEAALVPGWHEELPREQPIHPLRSNAYVNAIGPVALGSAVTLAIAARDHGAVRRVLDAATVIGLAGVLAATVLVTVPINKQIEAEPARDYPSERSQSLVKNWSRAHAVRTTLGIGAFVCAVASNLTSRK